MHRYYLQATQVCGSLSWMQMAGSSLAHWYQHCAHWRSYSTL